MVLSYYVIKYPYQIIWSVFKFLKLCPNVVVYCAEPIDYFIWENVQTHLPEIQIIAARKMRKFFRERGIKTKGLPSFPKAVIMFRHAAYKFPQKDIIKIGFRHGAYNFKQSTKALNYNLFNVYLTGSQRDLEEIKKLGVVTGKAIGFPKMDPIFKDKFPSMVLDGLRGKLKLDPSKKTVIFTATYDTSGMSAIQIWIDHLKPLSDKFNILVTVHGWMSDFYVKKLKTFSYITFIDKHENVIPYLALSDLLVGDSSSIIAEFCALDKPIVTFKVSKAKRSRSEIGAILERISYQIDEAAGLEKAIEYSLQHPEEKREERRHANLQFFYKLDGRAGERAAAVIKEWVQLA